MVTTEDKMKILIRYVLTAALCFSGSLIAADLPRVTGLTLTGDTLSWDAQDGATGYNIHLDYEYYDTVRGGLQYTVSLPGDYHVISFNDQGDFGVTRNEDEIGMQHIFVTYEAEGPNNSISYTYNYATLTVQHTCRDVGPGETCIAACPSEYQLEAPFGSRVYTDYLSGGACSTSDIVEADAFIGPQTYSCTVPTYSGEVVAQAICVLY